MRARRGAAGRRGIAVVAAALLAAALARSELDAQSSDADVAFAIQRTPIGALPPLLGAPTLQSRNRGMAVHAQLGVVGQGDVVGAQAYALAADVPVAGFRVSARAGYVVDRCARLTCADGVLGGAGWASPRIVRPVGDPEAPRALFTGGVDVSAGLGRSEGEAVWSVAAEAPLAVSVAPRVRAGPEVYRVGQASVPYLVPFVAPGLVHGVLDVSGERVSGTRPTVALGIGVWGGRTGLSATVAARWLFSGGAGTQFGVGVAWHAR